MLRFSHRPRQRFLLHNAVLLAGCAAALAGAAAPAQAGIVASFDWPSAGNHSFQVPPGVDTAVVDLYGAQGGSFIAPDHSFSGGLGGHVHTIVTLAAGQTWQATVGGAGQSENYIVGGAGGCTAQGGAGGFGGGGVGGSVAIAVPSPFCYPGSGGGGPTSFAPSGAATATVIAAGGGGATVEGSGGAGGGTTGSPGVGADATVAQGGTLTAGGAGGIVSSCNGTCSNGTSGVAFGGGNGGVRLTDGGGGGGGGAYGGGGGASGSGAGGASGPAATAPGDVNQAGAQSGDGRAVIVYGSVDAPTITADSAPHVRAGVPYSYRFGAVGWPGPIVWTVYPSPGLVLPDGLTLATDGTLSGTATQPGTYPVELRARNFTTSTFDMLNIVVDAGPPVALRPSAAQTTLAGSAFPQAVSASLVDAYGNPVPGVDVHFALPLSPPTATFDATGTMSVDATSDANGVASAGTLTAGSTGGAYAVAISTAGLPGASVALTADAPPAFSPGTPPQPIAGDPYSWRYATTGYPAPTVTRVAGKLPPGTALAADGTLSGTPSKPGTYRFTLQATNGIGAPASLPAELVVHRARTATIHDASFREGNSGTTTFVAKVTLSIASPAYTTFRFQTADGSAQAGSDYEAESGMIYIGPGQTSGSIFVTVYGDRLVEPNETFTVTLTSPVGALLARDTATLTIRNDD